MKILVTVKRVPDPESTIKVNSEGTGIVESGIKWVVNPFDEIAIEEALRIKETRDDVEVVLVSIGGADSQEQLRTGLAMGADRAILVTAEGTTPAHVARILSKLVEKESPDLMLMGKQAIDGDNNQTGQMLAALMGIGQATFASELVIDGSNASVTREVDGGLQTLTLPLPVMVTADLRLNEPRYASLPNIMKAKKKPLDTTTPEELGVDVAPRVIQVGVELPAERQAGIKVDDVAQLVDKLKNEAKVIS